jgi:hypothetical protein
MRALGTFVDEVYAPGLHLVFAAAWFLALQGTVVVAEGHGRVLRLDAGVLACMLTIFLALFFLRVLDEWKDCEYDRVHNPERPLGPGCGAPPRPDRLSSRDRDSRPGAQCVDLAHSRAACGL